MKSAISLFSTALIAICALSSLCITQNVSINLEPINPPIQIPAPGGNFGYNVTVTNTGASPQTFDAWIMVQLPDSSWYGPVLGPVNLTLPSGGSVTRQRTQPVPESAPSGTYVYEGRVGAYPNTVWNSSSFTFAKTLEGNQLWAARYNGPGNGGDIAHSLAVDGAGNVYVTGGSDGSGTATDYATIKYNFTGVQQWAERYNGPGNSWDEATSLAVDGAGNVYVTGWSAEVPEWPYNYDYTTIKYDSLGVLQWIARYNGPGNGDDMAHALTVDGAGNVYVTGGSYGGGTNFDYATVKYDSAGVQQWTAHYDGPPGNNIDEAYSLVVDAAGNVYVTGDSYGNGTGYDYGTVKYNSAGVQQWIARYNGPGSGNDHAHSLALDGAGNAVVTGYSYVSGTNYDYTTIKYDSTGVPQWIARYNGPGNYEDWAFSVAVEGAGNVYVTGMSFGSGTASDYATIKYSSAGVQQWVARYNGPGNNEEVATSLGLDETGNVYVTGFSWGSGTVLDYATIKYNSAGVQQWVARYNGLGNGVDEASCLAVDGARNVFITGHSLGSGTDYDYATIKYSCGNPSGAGSYWQPVEALVFGAQEAVTEYQLRPCYPNPFNATTALSYELRAASFVSLRIYDSAGRLVTALVDGWREAGTHELTFDAGDLPSGVYFCKMLAGEYAVVQKLVLLK